MSRTIVVVPCYNEEHRFQADRYLEFVQQHSGIDLLLVNDGSRDATLSVLQQLRQRRADRIRVENLPENCGKAEAVRRGMLRAFAARPDFVAFWDADLATPLDAVPQFRQVLATRQECQLVLGSRVALLGRRVERRWTRHVLGRAFATVASCVLGLPVYDTQCGAKMFRVSPEMEAIFAQPFVSRWIFDVELLARLLSRGTYGDYSAERAYIYELPLDRWRDVAGSKLKGRDFAKAVWELARIYRIYRYRRPGGRPAELPSSVGGAAHGGRSRPRAA